MSNAYSGVATSGDTTALSPALLAVYSADIEHNAQSIMRFHEFVVEKEELTKQPGESITFTTYADIDGGGELTETDDLETKAMSASTDSISVTEYGNAIGVREKLLQLSYDDVLEEAAVLLGRNYAKVVDTTIRDAYLGASSTIYAGARASRAALKGGTDYFDVEVIRVAVETLDTAEAPKFFVDGDEFYVCFLHPHASAYLKRDPDWVAANNYANTRRLFTGELGRWEDVIFISTTHMLNGAAATTHAGYSASLADAATGGSSNADVYQSVIFGDNAVGRAIALPVEMRDNGVQDFGRKHGLAWYSIEGFDILNDDHIVVVESV